MEGSGWPTAFGVASAGAGGRQVGGGGGNQTARADTASVSLHVGARAVVNGVFFALASQSAQHDGRGGQGLLYVVSQDTPPKGRSRRPFLVSVTAYDGLALSICFRITLSAAPLSCLIRRSDYRRPRLATLRAFVRE